MSSQSWTFVPESIISMPMETKNTFVHYNDLGTTPSPRALSDTECDYASMQSLFDSKIHHPSGTKSKCRPGKRLRDRMKQRTGAKRLDALDQRSAACLPSNHKLFVAFGVCVVLTLSFTWVGLTTMYARQLAAVDMELRAKEIVIDELNKTLLLEKERQEYLRSQEEDEKMFSQCYQGIGNVQAPENVQAPIPSLRDESFNYVLLQILLVAFASGFGIQSVATILRSPEGSSTGGFTIAVSTIFIIRCMVADGALEPLMCGAAPILIQFAVSIVAKLFVPSSQDLTEESRVCLTGYPRGSSYGTVTLFENEHTVNVKMDDGSQMSVHVSSLKMAPKPGGACMMGILKGLLVSLPIWCFGLTTLAKALEVMAGSIIMFVIWYLVCGILTRFQMNELGETLLQKVLASFWLVCFFMSAALGPIDGATRIFLSIFTGILGTSFSYAYLGAAFEWQAHTIYGLPVTKNSAILAPCPALSW